MLTVYLASYIVSSESLSHTHQVHVHMLVCMHIYLCSLFAHCIVHTHLCSLTLHTFVYAVQTFTGFTIKESGDKNYTTKHQILNILPISGDIHTRTKGPLYIISFLGQLMLLYSTHPENIQSLIKSSIQFNGCITASISVTEVYYICSIV